MAADLIASQIGLVEESSYDAYFRFPFGPSYIRQMQNLVNQKDKWALQTLLERRTETDHGVFLQNLKSIWIFFWEQRLVQLSQDRGRISGTMAPDMRFSYVGVSVVLTLPWSPHLSSTTHKRQSNYSCSVLSLTNKLLFEFWKFIFVRSGFEKFIFVRSGFEKFIFVRSGFEEFIFVNTDDDKRSFDFVCWCIRDTWDTRFTRTRLQWQILREVDKKKRGSLREPTWECCVVWFLEDPFSCS